MRCWRANGLYARLWAHQSGGFLGQSAHPGRTQCSGAQRMTGMARQSHLNPRAMIPEHGRAHQQPPDPIQGTAGFQLRKPLLNRQCQARH